MQLCESTLITRMPAVAMVTINKPNKERLAWHIDEGFTTDLYLSPQRTHIANVTLTRKKNEDKVGITVAIENRMTDTAKDLRISAVIQDDSGIILSHSKTNLAARIDHLRAGTSETVTLFWQGSRDREPYHLLLIIEDAQGNMVDTLSGEFWSV